jgi:hypothetical protein
MSAAEQIPRNSIIWLLSAQLAVIIPLMGLMSWWMIAFWLLCAVWRVAMFRGEASFPGKIVRGILVALGGLGVAISFSGLGSLEIAVALLILAFSLKLIEVRTRRDMYLVFCLALFIVAAAFLFSQSIFLAIYQVFSVVLIITAMVATQHSLYNREPALAIRMAVKLVAQAVPVMILFFLVFPRIEPIWSVPHNVPSAGIGMSDNIEPGDIAKLNQSDELAFRVEFDGPMPLRQDMYWRGMTLSNFDGRKWSVGSALKRNSGAENTAATYELYGEPLRYKMTIEPTGKNWLFMLPIAIPIDSTQGSAMAFVQTQDFALRSVMDLDRPVGIEVESYVNYSVGLDISEAQRVENTKLPSGFNPRALRFSADLRKRTGSPQEYIDQLSKYLIDQDFYYTLEPPALGRDTVDDFIFGTRRGYCEHYANAFAFLLRAANIPARVVVGYQGGEINPHNMTLNVRQLDAHAWIEYWRAGSGWLRLDPTYIVAPDRIHLGFDGALERDSEFSNNDLLSPLFYRNIGLIKALRLRLDAINYMWQKKVVGFGAEEQRDVLNDFLGGVTSLKLGLLVAGILIIVLGTLALWILWGARGINFSPEKMLYLKFCKKVAARLGLFRTKSETPQAFAERIIEKYPQSAEQVRAITRQYNEIAYAGARSAANLAQLKTHIASFKPGGASAKL